MVGAGDEDHIITRVIPGTDPLQEFDEDNPTDVITIDHETDKSDVDAAQVGKMTTDQVSQAAATMVAKIGHIRGLHEITQVFGKAEVGLILATGVRKLHEYQCLKGK